MKFKRIQNLYHYIVDNVMDKIYRNVRQKHDDRILDQHREQIYHFISKCCVVLWNVLCHEWSVQPFTMEEVENVVYNERIHEKQGGYTGDNIRYCVFPALLQNDEFQTKMWVICEDEDVENNVIFVEWA